jgi:hypothetical protein
MLIKFDNSKIRAFHFILVYFVKIIFGSCTRTFSKMKICFLFPK